MPSLKVHCGHHWHSPKIVLGKVQNHFTHFLGTSAECTLSCMASLAPPAGMFAVPVDITGSNIRKWWEVVSSAWVHEISCEFYRLSPVIFMLTSLTAIGLAPANIIHSVVSVELRRAATWRGVSPFCGECQTKEFCLPVHICRSIHPSLLLPPLSFEAFCDGLSVVYHNPPLPLFLSLSLTHTNTHAHNLPTPFLTVRSFSISFLLVPIDHKASVLSTYAAACRAVCPSCKEDKKD